MRGNGEVMRCERRARSDILESEVMVEVAAEVQVAQRTRWIMGGTKYIACKQRRPRDLYNVALYSLSSVQRGVWKDFENCSGTSSSN